MATKKAAGPKLQRVTRAPAVGNMKTIGTGPRPRVINTDRLGKQFGTQPTPKRLKYFAKGTGKGSK